MKQPIHRAYDRLGRQVSAIVDGVSTNTYTYDSTTLALSVETQNGMEINRTTDALGRDTGFSLGSDYSVQYGFDAYGRFHSVSSSVRSVSSVVEYSRLANTDLISGMTASSGFLWTRAYESARSLITSVENRYGETVVSRYDYENDALGRRTHIERSGLAFGDLPVRDAYGYNPRSEVTSARRTPIGSQTELRGFSYDYEYDPIGNRTSSTEYDHAGEALESEYTANALNQYDQRTVPDYAGVRGEADTNAVVTVNANSTWRYGEYFFGGDEADNSTGAVMKQLEITATYSNLFTAVTGRVFVAQTPEAFTYDYDGNLTQDGRFGYTWNGENRLIKAETRDDLPASVPRVKVEYAYDHQGRMVWKQISTNTVVVSTRTLVWDGYNIVRARTHSQTHTLTNSYVWDLDLSGSLQGAGGVGGLLAEVQNGLSYLAAYDANGNVTEYLGADGTIAAHYEYSPFGEIVVQSGVPRHSASGVTAGDTFTHRFSTKPWCATTGLSEYEFRKYKPGTGRWLSRDPMDKRLMDTWDTYLFCRNNKLMYYDPDGREISSSAETDSSTTEEDSCQSLSPWNKPCVLGNTSWCFTCGKGTLTDTGKSLPAGIQACILKHEKQHEATCLTLSFTQRCCGLKKPMCLRAKDEVKAYEISLACAKEALDKGDIPDDEKKHWVCYSKSSEKQKAHYEKYVSDKCE